MKALVQRVSKAEVTIGGTQHSAIGPGLLVFLGVMQGDTGADARYLAGRCTHLRIFSDAEGKMNCSVLDSGGSVMVISQFTLCGELRSGHRPSFSNAAPPEAAEALYGEFIRAIAADCGEERVRSGVFRAMMEVGLVNDGPVTLMLESRDGEKH